MVNVCMGSHVVHRFYSEENSLTGSSEVKGPHVLGKRPVRASFTIEGRMIFFPSVLPFNIPFINGKKGFNPFNISRSNSRKNFYSRNES